MFVLFNLACNWRAVVVEHKSGCRIGLPSQRVPYIETFIRKWSQETRRIEFHNYPQSSSAHHLPPYIGCSDFVGQEFSISLPTPSAIGWRRGQGQEGQGQRRGWQKRNTGCFVFDKETRDWNRFLGSSSSLGFAKRIS